jgi:SAM-dependent methyltransferase
MNKNFENLYSNRSDALLKKDKGYQEAVGGGWEFMGSLQYDILKKYGLKPEHYLADIGCGSGRLANKLLDREGPYYGQDINSGLLEKIKEYKKHNWRLEKISGTKILEKDKKIDFIVFFSVFTHLFYEEIYVYLKECKRTLKQDGTIIFSFLDFESPNTWCIFENRLNKEWDQLDIFLDKKTIEIWCEKLGFKIIDIVRGDKPICDNRCLGQSVCVLKNIN